MYKMQCVWKNHLKKQKSNLEIDNVQKCKINFQNEILLT